MSLVVGSVTRPVIGLIDRLAVFLPFFPTFDRPSADRSRKIIQFHLAPEACAFLADRAIE